MILLRSHPYADADGILTPPGASQCGATLVEALITLLVMSIGLLGVAALQIIGTQENASALRQSQATWFAYDMADRMRANLAGVNAGGYDAIDTEVGEASPPSCGAGATCTPTQMATWDTAAWGASVGGLAGGTGTVDALGSSRFRIRVMWDDDVAGLDADDPDEAARITTGCPSDPSITKTCVEITVQP